jgi:hypothetical protein
MLDKYSKYANITASSSPAPHPVGAFVSQSTFQEYNSLSNLDTLRGVFGPHPGVRTRNASLARYSLSMRKPCLESYILERSNFLKTITITLIDHIDPTKNDHCNFLQVVIFDLCVETKLLYDVRKKIITFRSCYSFWRDSDFCCCYSGEFNDAFNFCK